MVKFKKRLHAYRAISDNPMIWQALPNFKHYALDIVQDFHFHFSFKLAANDFFKKNKTKPCMSLQDQQIVLIKGLDGVSFIFSSVFF